MFAPFMINTWAVATIVAVLAGVIGFFVVLRRRAFAAHAIPNGAFAGAAAANLIGINALLGLGAFSVLAALGIGAFARRGRNDAVTALVLVLMLALGALFLSRSSQYEPATYGLLFGEPLGVSAGDLLPVAAISGACLVAVAVSYRPLLLSSVLPEVAAARGLRAARVEILFLVILAAATAMTVPVVGALLIFSLLIGPPAAARTLVSRPPAAIALGVMLALVTVWASIAAAFWTSWPVGFFVGILSALVYGASRLVRSLRRLQSQPGDGAGHHHPAPPSLAWPLGG